MILPIAAVAGFVADFVFGDPVYWFHPVRLMGRVIAAGERLFLGAPVAEGDAAEAGAPVDSSAAAEGVANKTADDAAEAGAARGAVDGDASAKSSGTALQFLSGMATTVLLVSASFAIPYVLLFFIYKASIVAGLAVEAAFIYQIMATKALKNESMLVYKSLDENDIEKARYYVSRIVGRDTQELNEEEIAKAAVESIAESLSDGVIAPLLFIFIGGAPLGFAFKAVSTLDSMVGYRNERYEHFGKLAARLDDAANFVPARLSALLMIFGAMICGYDYRGAWRVYIRDRYKHKSPNSAHTESACAGALGIALSGDNYYGGQLVSKPVIGDKLRSVEKGDIIAANRLMYATAWLCVALGVAARVLLAVLV